ncbi:uncharacterized protein ACN427_001827 isoform 2-T2 [Glossina fuscipes fuscipes]
MQRSIMGNQRRSTHLFLKYIFYGFPLLLCGSSYIEPIVCELKFGNVTDTGLNSNRTSISSTSNSKLTLDVLSSAKFMQFSKSIKKLPLIKWENPNKRSIENTIQFIYYKNGKMLFKSSSAEEHKSVDITKCSNEKISMIFHGWMESCNTNWVIKLRERLTYHRGGCIICIDYGYWAEETYLKLWRNFDIITEVLYKEILSLIHKGLNPRQSFLFGFSYGGHIVSTIGRRLPPKYKFKKIDICDMAGPGFDFFTDHNHKDAADNVQCYYSSIGKGTRFYDCHQNIRLGQCGYSQLATLTQSLYSSHGLCVQIYINAFDHPFYALQNPPRWCATVNPAQNLPKYFTIGYKESGYRHIRGDIFVPTGLKYPYNLSKKQLARFQALHDY